MEENGEPRNGPLTLWSTNLYKSGNNIQWKNADDILIEIALQIALGKIDILTKFVLPVHEHGMLFHFFVSPLIFFV